MAKKKSESRERPPESSALTEKNSSKSNQGIFRKMVLRVRRARQLKDTGEEQGRAASGTKRKTTSKKVSKVDSKMPKKPPTAFFFFLEDFRKEFQEKNPDVKSMRDIGKACGEKWKIMTYEEKVQYYDIATEKRREFDRAMADYNKRKENGEFKEYEDDSDFDD
ncbi:PREDICTED: high mobility group B protein 14 isoform X1 [Ipomoea nil]|uniref:high mobility group B protein 14 isoform X1 n=1 Tax=Ipomoea nil TaxID=35883 RepID=UPI000900BB7C|nr:PREDICTED: high mobility group B protein 14 isoform X1 [Ipomoea nil]XP_019189322.1 PREDICTED: high mobility group B protein 14 isoform X1 [Ipomoea nil]